MTQQAVDRSDIEEAEQRIQGFVRRTPVLELGTILSDSYTLALKLEHLQLTGSFKPRGAFSVLTGMDTPASGVVAASGGNFGIAVAHAAATLGLSATVFVPETSPEEKIGRIGEYGADVRVIPGYYDEARLAAENFAAVSGAFQAHAYDQPTVIAGQGTVAAEVESQTGLDVILCAVGGGGLMAGIATWFGDRVDVVAVEPELCRSFNAALQAGHPIEIDVSGVAASSLGARSIGANPWSARRWVNESILVTDDDIVAAQRWLWHQAKLAVEPAAATPVAALLSGAFRPEVGARVVALISGGNVDPGSVI